MVISSLKKTTTGGILKGDQGDALRDCCCGNCPPYLMTLSGVDAAICTACGGSPPGDVAKWTSLSVDGSYTLTECNDPDALTPVYQQCYSVPGVAERETYDDPWDCVTNQTGTTVYNSMILQFILTKATGKWGIGKVNLYTDAACSVGGPIPAYLDFGPIVALGSSIANQTPCPSSASDGGTMTVDTPP